MEWKEDVGKVVRVISCVLPFVVAFMETEVVQYHQKDKKLEAKHKFLIIGFAYVFFDYLLYAWDAFVARAKWSVFFFYKEENGKKIIFGEATHMVSAGIVLAHLITTILGLKTAETGLDVSDALLVFSWTYSILRYMMVLLEQKQLMYQGQQTLSTEGKLVNERRIKDRRKDPRTWEEPLLGRNVGLGNHYLTPREKGVTDRLAGRGREMGVEDDGLQKQVEGEILRKEKSGVALEADLRTWDKALRATNARSGRYLTPELERAIDQQARRWKEIEEVEDQGLQKLLVKDGPLKEEISGEDNVRAWEESLRAKLAASRERSLTLRKRAVSG